MAVDVHDGDGLQEGDEDKTGRPGERVENLDPVLSRAGDEEQSDAEAHSAYYRYQIEPSSKLLYPRKDNNISIIHTIRKSLFVVAGEGFYDAFLVKHGHRNAPNWYHQSSSHCLRIDRYEKN